MYGKLNINESNYSLITKDVTGLLNWCQSTLDKNDWYAEEYIEPRIKTKPLFYFGTVERLKLITYFRNHTDFMEAQLRFQ